MRDLGWSLDTKARLVHLSQYLKSSNEWWGTSCIDTETQVRLHSWPDSFRACNIHMYQPRICPAVQEIRSWGAEEWFHAWVAWAAEEIQPLPSCAAPYLPHLAFRDGDRIQAALYSQGRARSTRAEADTRHRFRGVAPPSDRAHDTVFWASATGRSSDVFWQKLFVNLLSRF